MNGKDGPRWCHPLFRLSIATLVYGFYSNLLGILIVLIATTRQVKFSSFKSSYIDPLTRTSLFLVSVGMGVSAWMAMDRGEAALQLTHFLPFFWLFMTLPILVRSPRYQSRIARDLVLTSIPVNLVAIAEYAVKTNRVPPLLQGLQDWRFLNGVVEHWRTAPHIGRAMVMFDHPNVLANYLVIVFGLGLGLLLTHSPKTLEPPTAQPSPKSLESSTIRSSPTHSPLSLWLWGATFLNLVGIFCSGSRNGILAVLLQLLLAITLVNLNRTLLLLGGISALGFGLGAFFLGLGTRPIGITEVSDDPRVAVWAIAADLIRARPWLGWGPGSFKFLYPERLIDPEYTIVFHPHNLWLLLGAEYGLLVMIGLTVTVGFICYRGCRSLGEKKQTSQYPSAIAPIDLNHTIASGYLLAFGGSVTFSLLDVTLYDARLNVINWVLLSVIYSWTLKPER